MLAKELGMGTFAYEAGWADDDLDYQPDAKKYADFRRHIEVIHSHGMQFVAWVAPSFTNPVSRKRFAGKLMGPRDNVGKIVNPLKAGLDPRYTEVRQYIIDAYCRIIRDYDIDGFFMDFLECFGIQEADEPDDPERDYTSVHVAIDRLLQDLLKQLKQIKPDILIEIRQPSIGPHMRKVANMFRAVDCGNCFADNRIRVLDIRMLCGSAIAHADPIMWNTSEPVQSAAMQLTHTLFAVPQISMNLETLPADHKEMVRTYLAFWNEHRDVILDGALTPLEPQSAYPLVLSSTADKFLAAVYSNAVIPIPANAPETVLIVNGTYGDHVVLESDGALGKRGLTVTSCTGEEVCNQEITLAVGLHRLEVPPNGIIKLKARIRYRVKYSVFRGQRSEGRLNSKNE